MSRIPQIEHIQRASQEGSPGVSLETFFDGTTRAVGLIEDRFGKLRRTFTVKIKGAWNGQELTLDEHFTFDDGQIETRRWTISASGDTTYIGQSDDIVDLALGHKHQSTVHWTYHMTLPIGRGQIEVRADDRMYFMNPHLMLNRSTLSKFGLTLAEITLCFHKGSEVFKRHHLDTDLSSIQKAI